MFIPLIQSLIREEHLDGWLFYDFHRINPIASKILAIPDDAHITRRLFYWIPRDGLPVKIVHKIEKDVLAHLPGEIKVYGTREELTDLLSFVNGKSIAMEYSYKIPTISYVDGGTLEFIGKLGGKIVSSGNLLQRKISVLDEEEIESHLEAANALDAIANDAFSFVRGEILQGKMVFESDVQNFILNRITDFGGITAHPPIVACGRNSANPHYAIEGRGEQILKDDFLLIDLWCKKRTEKAVYADITRVASGSSPQPDIVRAFRSVRKAQKKVIEYIEAKEKVRGCDADTIARKSLVEDGYEANIFHRTGHSIDQELHGYGTNLDSSETFDERYLIPNTCYSNEPALYFPNRENPFGIRLEHDFLYLPGGTVKVTGGVQDEIPILF